MDFDFNEEKNKFLLETRGICFEIVIDRIEKEEILDIIDHPNQNKYPGQQIYIISIDNYCYMVPCITNGNKRFLKTIIPNRDATKKYLTNQQKDGKL
jgi:uncharacterized DUF497 family protein